MAFHEGNAIEFDVDSQFPDNCRLHGHGGGGTTDVDSEAHFELASKN